MENSSGYNALICSVALHDPGQNFSPGSSGWSSDYGEAPIRSVYSNLLTIVLQGELARQ